jgi:LppP/LprE lipoprotein
MTRVIGGLAVLALGTCAAAALGGCGSQSNGASVASVRQAPTSTPATTTSTPTTPTTPTTTASGSAPAPASAAGGTAAPGSTHTAPEPAFTEQGAHTEGLKGAEAVLQAHDYTANEPSQYHPNQTLRVLIGTRTGSTDGYGQQAFFFVDGRYIGTDTKVSSAIVRVISQSDTEVALTYALYHAGDPLSSPSGGQATVRFALNDGKLAAMDPIPPAKSSTGPGRD